MFPFLLKLNFLQSTSRIIVVIAVMLVTSPPNWVQSSFSEIKSNELSSKVGENVIAFAKSFVNISGGKHACDDFYDFVCRRNVSKLTNDGSGNRHHHVERTIFNKFLQNDNTKNAEELMDSELKLKNFYVSCREGRSVEQLMESTLYKKCGGWPAIAASDSQKQRTTNSTWMDVVTEFHVIGTEYFFMHRIAMKSNRRVVELLPNTIQRFTLRKYEQLAEQVLIDYNVDAGRAHLIGLEIVNFERNRRKCLKVNNVTETNTTNPTHDADDENILMEMSYQEFKQKVFGASDINWDNYFRKVLGKPPKETDMVRVHKIEQFRNILELLRKTSTNCLLNYLWIEYLMGKSSKDCEMLAKEYFQPVYWQIVANSFTDKLQTAQMFSDIGKSYDPLRLPQTAWIDEMTHENSKQFLGRIIHLTLNGEAKIDEEYASLAVSEGNFYQNLEHCQRFVSERPLRRESGAGVNKLIDSFDSLAKIYLNVLPLLFNTHQPIVAPLNFPLIGEHFAEMMIAGGSSEPPGSWRSTDSDRSFSFFMQCLQLQQLEQQQQLNSISHRYANSLLLRILAQKQTFMAFAEWQANHKEFVNKIEKNISMSLNRTYFIAATLRDCESDATTTTSDHQRDFVNIYLRNSMDFIETFQCHEGNGMFPQTICLSLEDI